MTVGAIGTTAGATDSALDSSTPIGSVSRSSGHHRQADVRWVSARSDRDRRRPHLLPHAHPGPDRWTPGRM